MDSPADPRRAAALQDERDGGSYLASLQPGERQALLAEVKALSQLRAWRSIAALLGDWAVIAGSITAAFSIVGNPL